MFNWISFDEYIQPIYPGFQTRLFIRNEVKYKIQKRYQDVLQSPRCDTFSFYFKGESLERQKIPMKTFHFKIVKTFIIQDNYFYYLGGKASLISWLEKDGNLWITHSKNIHVTVKVVKPILIINNSNNISKIQMILGWLTTKFQLG